MTADFAAQIAIGLSEGRALAESLMTATCRVLRKTGPSEQDETSGAEVAVYEVLFESKCKIQLTDSVLDGVDAGGRQVVVYRVRIDLPVSSPQVAQYDVAEILTNPADTRVVGLTYLIQAPMNKTYATATRLQAESARIPMVVSE